MFEKKHIQRRFVFFVFLMLCISCSTFSMTRTAHAWGEIEEDGFPIWLEVMQLVLTNRVRQDTAQAKKDYSDPSAPKNKTWATKDYPPCPPVVFHNIVAKAARLHSKDMDIQNYFDHTAKDGSSPGERVARQLGAPVATGENIAVGYGTPEKVTVGWLNSDGHRENMFNCSWTHLGVGYSKINRDYWTQNFIKTSLTRPLVHAGIHFPEKVASNEEVSFYANYYHKNGDAPQDAKVVVNGRCYDMRVEYGTAGNGNYAVKAQLSEGCMSYYFRFRGPDGNLELFPTRGSYQVGVGASCDKLYVANQKEAQCDTGCSKDTDCASHQECKESKCVDTRRCQGNADCPTGTSCREQHCQPDAKMWDECGAGNSCKSPLSCMKAGSENRCSIPCQKYAPCPQGFACSLDGTQGVCTPRTDCTNDQECAAYHTCKEGKCIERGPCTKHADCPQGTMCKDALCVNPGTLGVTCQGERDCDTGSSCIPWSIDGQTQRACGFACQGADDCPKGSTCKEFGGGDNYCFGKPEPPPPPKKTEETPPPTGGCSQVPTSHQPSLGFLLLLLLFLRRRRV
ncbi:MAG: CAP domain-containing protein [Myxococcales bacterium]|nr:CAP domain-containing protein [Myxococcales bacterium]